MALREQSWTDLLTNETYVHPLNELVEPADLINRSVPPGAVPSLLHEAAHHACLSSAVGMTLAATDMEARRLAESGDKDDLHRASNSVLTNRAVLELYRPLLEGLALFAEFDSLPGSSRILSRPLLHVARHTVKAEKAAEWETELIGVLTDSRETRESIFRHRDVLGTSLFDPSGYLLGYLYVKTWARWASSQAPIFRDPDFVFFFLSEYFWNDHELAALLISDHSVDELRPRKPIVQYCLERILSTVERDTPLEEMATHFEETMLNYNIDSSSLGPGFHTGPAVFPGEKAAAARLQVHEFLEAVPPEDAKRLTRRNMFHLVSLPVQAEIWNGRMLRATFRGRPFLVVEAEESYRGAGGDGTFEVFVESFTKEPCIALTIGGELAHFSSPGNHADFVAQWGRQFPLARGSSGFVPAAEAISDRDGGLVARLGESFVDACREMLVAAYSRVGLAWVEPDGSARLQREPAGLRSLLGPELTESLAVLASVASGYGYLEEISPTKMQVELRMAADAITQRLGPHGIMPISLWSEQDEKGQDRTAISVYV